MSDVSATEESAGEEPSGGPSVEASGERAVAAGRDIGQVATGDFVTQVERATVLPAEAFAVGAVTGPVRYLPRRTTQFVGRERELALLDEAFETPGGVVVHAVHGLGGVGKSALAARWAAGRGADVNPVWWIAADSRARLDAGLADLGRALTPALAGTLPEAALRERTFQWLSAHDDWLLVLDNVDDPSDIEPLLARAGNGRFLVTTRRGATSWRGMARTLDLDVLRLGDAVELFTRIHDGSPDGVEELCAELGCLPLAIDQAAAYCREAGITPRAYLALLARRPASLYASGPEGGDPQRTVARVWRVTFDRLADTPKTAMLLHVLSWLGPEEIPREYVELPGDPLHATEAIRRLAAHSMITLGDGTISVHRLVQAVTRTADPADPHRTEIDTVGGRRVAVRALSLADSRFRLAESKAQLAAKDARLGEMRERLVDMRAGLDRSQAGVRAEENAVRNMLGPERRVWAAHVEGLAARYPAEEDTPRTATLFTKAGLMLAMSDPRRAVSLCERALVAALRAFGPNDVETNAVRETLAVACSLTGDIDRALELRTRMLADYARLLGPDHELTVGAREELARTVAEATDEARALGVTHRHVREAERALGADRPRAGATAQGALGATPDTDPSEDPEDPFQLLDLARAASRDGDRERALALAELAVAQARRDLGDASPVTLLVRAHQVMELRKAGENERAESLAVGVNDDALRTLGDSRIGRNVRRLVAGPDHPNSPDPLL